MCVGLSLTQIGGQNYSYAASNTVIFYAFDPTDASARYMWSWNNSYFGCGPSEHRLRVRYLCAQRDELRLHPGSLWRRHARSISSSLHLEVRQHHCRKAALSNILQQTLVTGYQLAYTAARAVV